MKGSGPVAWLTYLGVRVVFALMHVFPINHNLRTARWLVQVWIRLMPRHRERAVAHLTAALGQSHTPAQIRQMAAQCLESAAMFAVEAVCLPRLVDHFNWTRFIQLVNFDEVLELILAGRGVIMVTAHYGSFELVGHLIAALGFDIAAVMRPVDNDYLNRFLVETRRAHGLTLLNKKGATEQAEDILDRGAILAFIGDQDAGRKGCFVEFFGRPASTYKSIALLAMAKGVPIVVGYVRRRQGVARYEIGVQRIIRPGDWGGQEDPLRWITQTYSSAIEDFIRTEPAQYWWMHRRWKSEPGRKHETPRKAATCRPPNTSSQASFIDPGKPGL